MTTTETAAKYVTDREFDEARNEMLETFYSMTGMDWSCGIEFYFENIDRDWKSPKTMQVNWAAKGTKDPAETLKFANALAVAATLAASFKYNGCKIRYED